MSGAQSFRQLCEQVDPDIDKDPWGYEFSNGRRFITRHDPRPHISPGESYVIDSGGRYVLDANGDYVVTRS